MVGIIVMNMNKSLAFGDGTLAFGGGTLAVGDDTLAFGGGDTLAFGGIEWTGAYGVYGEFIAAGGDAIGATYGGIGFEPGGAMVCSLFL